MTPFILIEDGRRLTLQLCEMPRTRYVWFLFAAECQSSGFGADRLVARSEEPAEAPKAQKEGMTALLEQKRKVTFGPLLPAGQSLHRGAPAAGVDLLEQLVEGISTRLGQLADVLDLVRQRIAGLQAWPSETVLSRTATNSDPTEPSSSIVLEKSWRILAGHLTLLAPDGTLLTLSVTEERFILALFRSPEGQMTYEQARQAVAEASEGSEPSHGSVSVLVSRFRSKCRKRGVEAPLHTVRGKGYCFTGETAILML